MNKCLACGKDVQNKYCNVACQNRHLNKFRAERLVLKRRGLIVEKTSICEACKTEFKYQQREKDESKRFCSRRCANSIGGKSPALSILKEAKCIDCGKQLYIKKRVSSKTARCDECRDKREKVRQAELEKRKHVVLCEDCGGEVKLFRIFKVCKECRIKRNIRQPKVEKPKTIKINDICDDCGKLTDLYVEEDKHKKLCTRCKLSRAGRKGAKTQAESRRSKNEALFAELCKQYFKDVKCNEAIFNGWDADVIVEDYKIAVLWNGNWHHKKITKKHSVKQVQNRDKIKIKEIINCGYTPYVIDDFGKKKYSFVKEEFDKFCSFIDAR